MNKKRRYFEKKLSKDNVKGITLIALVVTIVILIILAGVTINIVTGEEGLMQRAKNASEKHREESAREKLELALTDLRVDKNINNSYNENEYIDNYLTSKEMIINDNIVLVDGWQFEIDRSKLQIIMNLGQGGESTDIILVANIVNAADYSKASINIEITCESEIDTIQINGQDEQVPEKQEGKYILQKQILENGNYTIYVKDKDNKYKVQKISIESISEDLEISSIEGIQELRNKVNAGATYQGKVITLTGDVDLQGSEENEWIPIGNSQKPFKGTFDGQNNTINNLYINEDSGYQALFGYSTGTIKNVTVKGEVTGKGYHIAGICAVNGGTIENCVNYIKVTNKSTEHNQTGGISARLVGKATIKNCTNYGEVYSNQTHGGGIVGHSTSENFVIDSCTNHGKVTGSAIAGGIIGGANIAGTIKNCTNNGEISSSNNTGTGGILGNYNGTNKIVIQNCINKAKVYSKVWASGGILGNTSTQVSIEKCINEGEISAGNGNCGGIAGSIGGNDTEIYTTTIDQCANKGYIFATGDTGNPSTGGIIGSIQFGDNTNISNCYNAGEVASTKYTSSYVAHGVGGIVGTVFNNQPSGVTKSKATVTNSYNINNIKNSYSANYAGHIIGRDHNSSSSVTNCYYLSTVAGKNTYGGTSTGSDTLKTYATKLGSTIWKKDPSNVNSGYPIFIWQ